MRTYAVVGNTRYMMKMEKSHTQTFSLNATSGGFDSFTQSEWSGSPETSRTLKRLNLLKTLTLNRNTLEKQCLESVQEIDNPKIKAKERI